MSNQEQHNETDGLEVFFTKYLQDGSLEPSKSTWENIDKVLEQDRKEKRKKRFLWFFLIGLGMLVSFSVAWFALWKNSGTNNLTSQSKTNGNIQIQDANSIASNKANSSNSKKFADSISSSTTLSTDDTHNTATLKATYSSSNRNTPVKIQLGAFKKKVNENYFAKIKQDLAHETGSDGITRYYILSTDTIADLETVRDAGFKDAFVKDESDLYSSALLASNISSVKTNFNVKENGKYALESSSTNKKNTGISNDTKHTPNSTSINVTLSNIVNTNVSIPKSSNTTPGTNNAISEVAVTKDGNLKVKQEEVDNKSVLAVSANHSPVQTTPVKGVATNNDDNTKQNNILAETQTLLIPPALKTVSDTNAGAIANSPPRKDSLVPMVKADTSTTSDKKLKKDTVAPVPFNRWAVSVIGGPNVFFHSSSFDQSKISKSENRPITYSGEARMEYFFLKNISGSFGINYQENKIQKDSTYFKFSKFITSDYVVNSSLGPMNINKDLLLQGYFLMAPVDSFFAAYSYKVKTRSLSVPLQMNWYFLNKSALKLSAGIGVLNSYVVSQNSQLTLIKEHTHDQISYNTVHANRFNMVLLLSLGCDVRINKRFYFTAAPAYKYGLTNYSNVPGVIYKPNYFSGTAGFKFHF